jgi:hypothetical protein
MAVTVAVLIPPVQLGTSLGPHLYTSAGVSTIIDKVTGTNTSGVTVTVDVHLVPSGGTASNTTKVVAAQSITPGECYRFPELVGQVLNPGDFVQALASTSTVLSLRASGRIVT